MVPGAAVATVAAGAVGAVTAANIMTSQLGC